MPLQGVLRERGDRDRVPLDLPGEVAALVPAVGDPERHLEHEQDQQREPDVGQEQATAHGAGRRRKPTPRTVSIQPGSPSLRRSEPTWTSIVFVCPYQSVSQTWWSSCCRVTTAPGSAASGASRSNSFAVSASSTPSRLARRARTSTSSAPTFSGRVARRRLVAARDGVDPGDQLAEAERLDHVVVGAELEADHLVDLLPARRDHDDRHVRALAQPAADRVAVRVGQAQVEEDDVGGPAASASAPVAARSTVNPSRRSPSASGSAIESSSSTSRTFMSASSRKSPA